MKHLTGRQCAESVEQWTREQEAAAKLRAERVRLAIAAAAISGLSAIQILYDDEQEKSAGEVRHG